MAGFGAKDSVQGVKKGLVGVKVWLFGVNYPGYSVKREFLFLYDGFCR